MTTQSSAVGYLLTSENWIGNRGNFLTKVVIDSEVFEMSYLLMYEEQIEVN